MAENEPAEAVDWRARAMEWERDALILRKLKEKVASDELNVSLKKPKSDDYPEYMKRRKTEGKIDKSLYEECWCKSGSDCGGTWGGTGDVGKKLRNIEWKPCLTVQQHRIDTYESWCRRMEDNRELLTEMIGEEKLDTRIKDAQANYDIDIKQLEKRLQEQGDIAGQPEPHNL